VLARIGPKPVQLVRSKAIKIPAVIEIKVRRRGYERS
jgi:hypothetical protein